MKKFKYILIAIALLSVTKAVSAQQFPFLQGYNINPFSLSPAYAGHENADYLFSDYRTDWTGIDGGPSTIQLSYNTKYRDKVGLGARIIYDKSDIFRQTLIMGTYSYKVELIKGHYINMAISAGTYRNSIDLGKYFNNPDYVVDPVLVSGFERSKLKFASDLSVLYLHGPIEGGIVFSNIMFGTAKYDTEDLTYKPLKNYLIHASYEFEVNPLIKIKPVVLVRGGQNSPASLEIAPQVKYQEKFWGTLSFRTGGVWGMGLGAEIMDGIMMNYSYNLSSNLALNTFGGHQITLGIRLVDLPKIGRD